MTTRRKKEPIMDDHVHATIAAAAEAAARAAEAASATVQAFANLSTKIDAGNTRLFDQQAEIGAHMNQLSEKFAVHLARSEREDDRIEKLEHVINGNGDMGLIKKIDELWTIDRVKLWCIRVIVVGGAGSIGCGLKHLFGW